MLKIDTSFDRWTNTTAHLCDWAVLHERFRPVHFQYKECLVRFCSMFYSNACPNAKSVNSDQTPRSTTSGSVLPMSILWDARNKWVNMRTAVRHIFQNKIKNHLGFFVF